MSHKLIVNNLNFRFNFNQKGVASKDFFKNLSLNLESGNLYLLTGKNGSGKSTLFRLFQGNINPQEYISGTIILDHKTIDLGSLRPQANPLKQYISLVKQDYDSMLIDAFTGEENLRLAAIGKYPKIAALPPYHVSQKILDQFNIPLNIPVKLLSGGQRQLIAILASLERPVQILLLDEPTAALDNENKFSIIKLLNDLAVEKNIIIVTICHDNEIISKHNPANIISLS